MVSPPFPMTSPTLLEATMTHSTLSPGLVDGLDGLAPLPNDQPDLVGGHHDALHLVPRP